MTLHSSGKVFRAISIVGVSGYLFSVLIYLLAKKRLESPIKLSSLVKSLFLKPYAGCLTIIEPYKEKAFRAPVSHDLISDKEDDMSMLVLYEDGYPLTQPKCAHIDIAEKGNGRYSHWGASIIFSTSDNSDPRTNGRVYSVREVR